MRFAIDFHEGDTLDEASPRALVLEVAGPNTLKMRERSALGMGDSVK
jgi:hypothetical protein